MDGILITLIMIIALLAIPILTETSYEAKLKEERKIKEEKENALIDRILDYIKSNIDLWDVVEEVSNTYYFDMKDVPSGVCGFIKEKFMVKHYDESTGLMFDIWIGFYDTDILKVKIYRKDG